MERSNNPEDMSKQPLTNKGSIAKALEVLVDQEGKKSMLLACILYNFKAVGIKLDFLVGPAAHHGNYLVKYLTISIESFSDWVYPLR